MGKLIDLTGQHFGRLTVVERSPITARSGSQWVCQCECGNVLTVAACNLKSGNTQSCGCHTKELAEKTRIKRGLTKNLEGQVFGKLFVLSKAKERSGTNPVWECVCECGTVTKVIQENLLNGHTRSCGCMRYDIGNFSKTHNLSNTRLYRVWRGMIHRCENPASENYASYGGRGISICDEWRNDFQAFYNWAMANGYEPDAPFGQCTIDRIDVNGNYHPENCRWVSMEVQNQNKRKKNE